MFRFLQNGSTPVSNQDVEMAIDATQTSTHTTIYPPVPPEEEFEVVPVEVQPPAHTPHQNVVDPRTLAFIQEQQTIINACMEQVSH